jgi:hypothetical protein
MARIEHKIIRLEGDFREIPAKLDALCVDGWRVITIQNPQQWTYLLAREISE